MSTFSRSSFSVPVVTHHAKERRSRCHEAICLWVKTAAATWKNKGGGGVLLDTKQCKRPCSFWTGSLLTPWCSSSNKLLHLIPSGPPLTCTIQPLNKDGEGHKAWQTEQRVLIKCLAGERRGGRLTQWKHREQLDADSHLVSSCLSKPE